MSASQRRTADSFLSWSHHVEEHLFCSRTILPAFVIRMLLVLMSSPD